MATVSQARLGEWFEQVRAEHVAEGVEEGVRRGREEERRLLCGLASRRFGDTTAGVARPLLGSMRDETGLASAGALIVDSKTGTELLDGLRRLAKSNDQRT